MPLYELLCLARPQLPRDRLLRLIQGFGDVVYTSGGVVTKLTSYGEQYLAYDIRKSGNKYEQVRQVVVTRQL